MTLGALALLGVLVWAPAQAAEPPPEPSEAEKQARTALVGSLRRAMALIESGKPEEARALIAEVKAQAEASGDSDQLGAALVGQTHVLAKLGDQRAALSAIQAATPLLCAASQPLDRADCAWAKMVIGTTMAWLGEAQATAQLEEAIRQARADVRPEIEIHAENALGEALLARDALTEAEGRFQRALQLATKADDDDGRWGALSGLGRVALARGALAEAEAHHEAALQVIVLNIAPMGEALSRYELSRVWARQGRLIEADKGLRFALIQLTEFGEPPQQANVMLAQGVLALERGRLIDAEALFRQALTLKVQHDHPYGRMRALIGLGDTLAQKGALTEAKQTLDEANTLAEAIGSRSGAAAAMRGLGAVQLLLGDAEGAEGTFERAVQSYAALGMPYGHAEALLSLGSAQAARARHEEAAQSFEQALDLTTRHGFGSLEARVRREFADALYVFALGLRDQQEFYEAERMWRRGIAVAALGRDPSLEAEGYAGLAVELIRQGQPREAEAAFRQSLELLESLRRPPQTALIQWQLADVLAAQGKLPEAQALFVKAAEGFGAVGDGPRQAFTLLDLAENQTQQGQLVEAEQTLEKSLPLAASLPDPYAEVVVRETMARWLIQQDRRAEAEALLAPCVDRAQSSLKEPEQLQLICLVALTDAQDAPRAAYRSAQRAVDLAESFAEPRWQAVAQVRLGRTALRRGKKAEAEAALRLALDSGELLGEPELRLEAMGLLAGILEARGETEEAAALREEESALRAWLEGG